MTPQQKEKKFKEDQKKETEMLNELFEGLRQTK